MRKLVFDIAVFGCVALYCLQSTATMKDESAAQDTAGSAMIVFMTDFGIQDDSVAICKGVMWSIAREARIVDITHLKPARNPAQYFNRSSIENGARLLFGASPYYPAGTVFLAIINPRVGTRGKPLVVKTKPGQYFVLPDNGLITMVQDRDGIEGAREMTNPSWMKGDALSSSFEGRDVFSPVAAHLARGDDWNQVGSEVKALVRIKVSAAKLDASGITGEVISVEEPYGNVVTNVSGDDLRKLGYDFGQDVRLTIANRELLVPFVKMFSDVEKNKPLLYVDSRGGHLGLAIRQGDFARAYGVTPPQPILIVPKK